jgi:glycosyltransferase involved in cell wall biosynthesis
MLELIRDEDKRRRMGAAAIERVQEYNLERVGRQWDELIADLAGEDPPSARKAEAGAAVTSGERA